jgi:hypothetical protein
MELGREMLDTLSNILTSDKNGKGLKKFLGVLGVSMPALGILSSVLMLSIPSSNEDLEYIKDRFDGIEVKVDKLMSKFEDFLNSQDYRHSKDKLHHPFSKIKTGMHYLTESFTAQLNQSICTDIANDVHQILYIANGNLGLDPSIFDSLYTFSQGHRQRINDFGTLMAKYVTEGIGLTMACEKLKVDPKSDEEVSALFRLDVESLRAKIDNIIDSCNKNVKQNIEKISKGMHIKSDDLEGMKDSLAEALKSSFDWLHCFVVVHEDQSYSIDIQPYTAKLLGSVEFPFKEKRVVVIYFEEPPAEESYVANKLHKISVMFTSRAKMAFKGPNYLLMKANVLRRFYFFEPESDDQKFMIFDGPFGLWERLKSCPPGSYVTRFRTKVESGQFWGDDTGMTEANFYCDNGKPP